jgi:hypothetical protein
MRLGFTDISLTSYGRTWTYTRNYGNRSAANFEGGPMGVGWSDSFTPTLRIRDTVAILRSSPQTVYFFDLVAGQYVARFYFKNRIFLTLNTDEPDHPRYVLSTPRGRTYYFDGRPTDELKPLERTKEPNGDLIDSVYELGRLMSSTRMDAGLRTGFYYTYGMPPRQASVTFELQEVDIWRATYTYYSSGESGGSEGDLKTVAVERRGGASDSWHSLGTTYYRYYLAEEAGGFEHAIKFVVNPEAYARMETAGTPPETAADSVVAGYADYFFAYDELARVSREVINGGALSYDLEYVSGGGNVPPDPPPEQASPFNQWDSKTIVTMGDGTQEIAYTNPFAQVMLKVFRSYEGEWCRYWRYNDDGQVILAAEASAVAGMTR